MEYISAHQNIFIEQVLLITLSVVIIYSLWLIVFTLLKYIRNLKLISKAYLLQNHNNWRLDTFLFLSAAIFCFNAYFYNEDTVIATMAVLFAFWWVLDKLKFFSSLNQELEKVFSEDRHWIAKLFGVKYKVNVHYLNENTFIEQISKIKDEFKKSKISIEKEHQLDQELSTTLNILSSIDAVYKKSLKNLTTLSKNKALLIQLYEQLVQRYDYFDKKYHDLLEQNYQAKSDFASFSIKNEEIDAIKNELKNI